jgi:hypothetical protein
MTSPRDTGSHEPDAGSVPPIDYCARCRYPLTGIPDDAPCPECASRRRRSGNPDEASVPSIVALALGVISAVILFLGPLALGTILLGPAAAAFALYALITGRHTLRQDALPAIVGLVLGGGAFVVLIGVLSFALFLTTP